MQIRETVALAESSGRERAGTPLKIPGLRWWIAGLLFAAAVLNYVDKNAFALLAPTIQKDLGIDDRGYASIQNAFQIAYTVALLGSGFLVDRLGARLSLALFVAWWSFAGVFTSLARSAVAFGSCRFLLGLGEAGGWTASPKTVSEWFPARERGLAIGFYTAGTPIGMTLAPLFIIGLAGAFGWRAVFVAAGLLGLFWLVPWGWLCRPPGGNPLVTRREREWIQSDLWANAVPESAEPGWTWGQTLRRPEVWCLLVGRMISDPVWFFYQNWYPKYLVSARGLTQGQVEIVWVMFLMAGLGGLAGGWIAGRLIKRGGSPLRMRLRVMLACALLMPLSPLVAFSASTAASLAFASVIVFAHLAWLTNISALVVDVAPRVSLGKVFGLVAAGSSLGAIAMNDIVAGMLKNHSYTGWFVIAAGLHLAVFPVVMRGVLRRPSTS